MKVIVPTPSPTIVPRMVTAASDEASLSSCHVLGKPFLDSEANTIAVLITGVLNGVWGLVYQIQSVSPSLSKKV